MNNNFKSIKFKENKENFDSKKISKSRSIANLNQKKQKNTNRGRSNYKIEEKEFENKTFFSTELNMLGKKKSSPPK